MSRRRRRPAESRNGDEVHSGDRQVQHRHRQVRRLGDPDPDLRDQLRSVRALCAAGADRVGLRRQLYPLRHAVHAGGALCTGPQRACAGRFPLSAVVAGDAGQARSRALYPVLLSRHHRARLGRLQIRGLLLADQGTLLQFAERAAALPFQVADPDRRRADDGAGAGGGGALRHLHPHRRLAGAPARRRGNREAHSRTGRRRAGAPTAGNAI